MHIVLYLYLFPSSLPKASGSLCKRASSLVIWTPPPVLVVAAQMQLGDTHAARAAAGSGVSSITCIKRLCGHSFYLSSSVSPNTDIVCRQSEHAIPGKLCFFMLGCLQPDRPAKKKPISYGTCPFCIPAVMRSPGAEACCCPPVHRQLPRSCRRLHESAPLQPHQVSRLLSAGSELCTPSSAALGCARKQ